MIIWDELGQDRFRTIHQTYYKRCCVIIIVFDLSEPDTIVKSLFDYLKSELGKNEHFIYLVGNKLDKTKEFLEEYRKIAKILLDSGIIDKYFEVSAKTGEGIEHFYKYL